jgi:hypothetical protein
MNTEENYGKLPEVRVDEGIGAIFPMPLMPPHRASWFSAAAGARHCLREISKLDSSPVSIGSREELERASAKWAAISGELISLAEQFRYLEFWDPELRKQWKDSRAHGAVPAKFALTQALSSHDPKLFEELRDVLRPHRIRHPPFLPDDLDDAEAGIIEIPIATDVSERKFLAEIEGALATHWNQSSWAREKGITFHIRWYPVAKDREFASGEISFEEHLAKFPPNLAAMTTGGLTTHVVRQALVLGPDRINPRGIAHELGHLMGFPDCYLRTLNSQGFFGLAVLEWDNPIYPDDLMCDNSVGVPRAEVW